MKPLNPLEMELRSWTPRRPSASLKARIFAPRPAVPDASAAATPRRETWWAPLLAPAMACFLLVVGFSKTNGPALGNWNHAASPALATTAGFTNAVLPAGEENRFTVEQNSVPARHFERLLAFRVPTNADDRHLLATNASGR